METFTDGVFAIAATLLILEISVDTTHTNDLGSALLHLWPSYLAYVTSFITIGIIWMNHHTCVETMVKVDRTFLFLNLLLLMTVSFFRSRHDSLPTTCSVRASKPRCTPMGRLSS